MSELVRRLKLTNKSLSFIYNLLYTLFRLGADTKTRCGAVMMAIIKVLMVNRGMD